MNLKKNYRQILRIALIVIIIATLAFIFYQSMLSKEESSAESNKVGGIIAEIIPPDTPVGEYVQTNIRKIAHFTEFFVLGCEIAVYVWLFTKKSSKSLFVYPLALLVALFDETVQVFSDRGPLITDVWVDFLGFISAYTPIFVIPLGILHTVKKIKQRKGR